jgi:hypothetical protein
MKGIQAMKVVNWRRCLQDINKGKSIVEQAKPRVRRIVTPGMKE